MNTYCGFLQKRHPILKSWSLYWFTLKNGMLSYYNNETENKLLQQILITDNFTIQLKNSDLIHKYIFEITDNTSIYNTLILSAPNSTIIESWFIAILQIINGGIRESENFYTGQSREGIFSPIFQPLYENPEITSIYQLNPPGCIEKPILPSPVEFLIGKFRKRSLHKNVWKVRWIVLRENMLHMYNTEEDALQDKSPRGSRKFFPTSKIALLPPDIENQKYCFGFITSSPPHSSRLTLRLSCETENQLTTWMNAIKIEILHSLLKHEQYENELQIKRSQSPHNSIKLTNNENSDINDNNNNHDNNENNNDNNDNVEYDRESRVRPSQINTIEENDENSNTLFSIQSSIKSALRIVPLIKTSITSRIMSPTSNLITSLTPTDIILNYFTSQITFGSHITEFIHQHKTDISLYLQISVFENQRFVPISGWSSSYLIPFTDHSTYSNVYGIKYPFNNLNRSLPPTGCQWFHKYIKKPKKKKSILKKIEINKQRNSNELNQSYKESNLNLEENMIVNKTYERQDNQDNHDLRGTEENQPELKEENQINNNNDDNNNNTNNENNSNENNENKQKNEYDKNIRESQLQEQNYRDSDIVLVTPDDDNNLINPLNSICGFFEFEVDKTYTTTDDEGWVYAASFERFTYHLAENCSHSYRKGMDIVRRRKWVRIARIKTS